MKFTVSIALTTLCALPALLLTPSAQAVQVVSDTNPFTAGATIIDFNNFDNLITAGPLELGAVPGSVVFTSTPNTTVGANSQDLGTNGLWGVRGTPLDGLIATPTGDGNFLASSFVTRRGEMGFSFANPVAKVGAFFNQFQATGVVNSLRLIAYDADGNDLESFNFTIDTAADLYNEGKFLGFSRASADIYGFAVADGTFVMDNLTLVPVPEPRAYALLLAGLGVLGWLQRRQRRA